MLEKKQDINHEDDFRYFVQSPSEIDSEQKDSAFSLHVSHTPKGAMQSMAVQRVGQNHSLSEEGQKELQFEIKLIKDDEKISNNL